MELLFFEGFGLTILCEFVDGSELFSVDLAIIVIPNALICREQPLFPQKRVCEAIAHEGLGLFEPVGKCLANLPEVVCSQVLKCPALILAVRGRGECFDDGIEFGL